MTYLGISLLGWAGMLWIALAGTFVTLLVYRVLIRVHDEDRPLIAPGELRQAGRHLREVDAILKGLGWAAIVLAMAIAAVWVFGVA